MVVEPPGAGQQHELHVGQAQRGQHGRDLALPAQGRVPEPEARAVVGPADRYAVGLVAGHSADSAAAQASSPSMASGLTAVSAVCSCTHMNLTLPLVATSLNNLCADYLRTDRFARGGAARAHGFC